MAPLLRPNLSTKIVLIGLLNLVLIALVLAVFVRVQYRFDLQSFLIAPAQDRILSTARQIALELRDTDQNGWDKLLQRYEDANRIELRLMDDDGRLLAGSSAELPASVLNSLHRHSHPQNRPQNRDSSPFFLGTTSDPVRHWVGVRIPIPSSNEHHHVHGMLIAASTSLLGTPFFFDPKPWLAVAFTLILVSVACWLPFGRQVVRSVSRMNRATSQIAEGQFKVQLPVTRRDELGQLSSSINRMAMRLDGYLAGQKRFLGDTAHELCSPIARMQVAMGILERSAGPTEKDTIADLRDDLEQMSKLVNDVLSFSKAGLLAHNPKLEKVQLADLVRGVLEREVGQEVNVSHKVPEELYVRANRDLLDRALSNIIRNAVRYAGTFGPIEISASREDETVVIRVSDSGPGLPESDLDRIFDPFYRLEPSRGSDTGGVGLGLAIVKSCVEACGGSVACRNIPGLQVEIRLTSADAQVGNSSGLAADRSS